MKVQLNSDGCSKWYLATIITVITIDGEAKNVVHKNLHLIQAESDEDAYDKALNLGTDSETSYLNSKDQLVDISFYGLAELEETIELDIYDGVELTFKELEDVSTSELKKLLPLKKDLGIFFTKRTSIKENELDYGSKEIRAMVEKATK